MKSTEQINRLVEVIRIAKKLGWVMYDQQTNKMSYPPMQLSEVEKCMFAMVDDFELKRMQQWEKEEDAKSEINPVTSQKEDEGK